MEMSSQNRPLLQRHSRRRPYSVTAMLYYGIDSERTSHGVAAVAGGSAALVVT